MACLAAVSAGCNKDRKQVTVPPAAAVEVPAVSAETEVPGGFSSGAGGAPDASSHDLPLTIPETLGWR